MQRPRRTAGTDDAGGGGAASASSAASSSSADSSASGASWGADAPLLLAGDLKALHGLVDADVAMVDGGGGGSSSAAAVTPPALTGSQAVGFAFADLHARPPAAATAASSAAPPPPLSLSDWGLPAWVVASYAGGHGIRSLYPWQAECLRTPGVTLDTARPVPAVVDAATAAVVRRLELPAMAQPSADAGAPPSPPPVPADAPLHACSPRWLLYCAPTSGGKSLVAEVLMIRRLFQPPLPPVPPRLVSAPAPAAAAASSSAPPPLPLATAPRPPSRRALVVVPYRALVEERTAYLDKLLNPHGGAAAGGGLAASLRARRVGVVGLCGGKAAPPKVLAAARVIVCTIERATGIVNDLVASGGIASLAAVVVDELHLLGEAGRGAKLEALLTKLKLLTAQGGGSGAAYAQAAALGKRAGGAWQQRPLQLQQPLLPPHGRLDLQVIGMSATLPNLPQLAAWLGASLFVTAFRPVPLAELVCADGRMYLLRDNGALVYGRSQTQPQQQQKQLQPHKVAGAGSTAAARRPGGGPGSASAPSTASASLTSAPSRPHQPPAPDQLAAQLRLHPVRALPSPPPVMGDGDYIVLLCAESVARGHQVIVFAPTRSATVGIAKQVAQRLRDAVALVRAARGGSGSGTAAGGGVPPVDATTAAKQRAEADRIARQRLQMVERLRAAAASPGGSDASPSTDSPLMGVLRAGVAFHNADLSPVERDVVVTGFRRSAVDVIVATSTLAAGVNLPAQRVVFAGAYVGLEPLDLVRYRQMAGRAGRAGLTDASFGEAILVVRKQREYNAGGPAAFPDRLAAAVAMVRSDMRPASSQLVGVVAAAPPPPPPSTTTAPAAGSSAPSCAVQAEPLPDFYRHEGAGLSEMVLEAIVTGLATTDAALLTYVAGSLHVHQAAAAAATATAGSGGDMEAPAGGSSSGSTGTSPTLPPAPDADALRRVAQPLVQHTLTFLLRESLVSLRRAPPSAAAAATAAAATATTAAVAPERWFEATELGKAAISSFMDPVDAVKVCYELQRARRRLLLAGELHVLYCVTPFVAAPYPPWRAPSTPADEDDDTGDGRRPAAKPPSYHTVYRALGDADRDVADAVGIEPALLQRAATSGSSYVVRAGVRFRRTNAANVEDARTAAAHAAAAAAAAARASKPAAVPSPPTAAPAPAGSNSAPPAAATGVSTAPAGATAPATATPAPAPSVEPDVLTGRDVTIHTRFWHALLLRAVVHGASPDAVARAFGCREVDVRRLVDEAGGFSAKVARFCAELHWPALARLAAEAHAVIGGNWRSRELAFLRHLPGMTHARARAVTGAGVTSLANLAAADADALADVLIGARPFQQAAVLAVDGGEEDGADGAAPQAPAADRRDGAAKAPAPALAFTGGGPSDDEERRAARDIVAAAKRRLEEMLRKRLARASAAAVRVGGAAAPPPQFTSYATGGAGTKRSYDAMQMAGSGSSSAASGGGGSGAPPPPPPPQLQLGTVVPDIADAYEAQMQLGDGGDVADVAALHRTSKRRRVTAESDSVGGGGDGAGAVPYGRAAAGGDGFSQLDGAFAGLAGVAGNGGAAPLAEDELEALLADDESGVPSSGVVAFGGLLDEPQPEKAVGSRGPAAAVDDHDDVPWPSLDDDADMDDLLRGHEEDVAAFNAAHPGDDNFSDEDGGNDDGPRAAPAAATRALPPATGVAHPVDAAAATATLPSSQQPPFDPDLLPAVCSGEPLSPDEEDEVAAALCSQQLLPAPVAVLQPTGSGGASVVRSPSGSTAAAGLRTRSGGGGGSGAGGLRSGGSGAGASGVPSAAASAGVSPADGGPQFVAAAPAAVPAEAPSGADSVLVSTVRATRRRSARGAAGGRTIAFDLEDEVGSGSSAVVDNGAAAAGAAPASAVTSPTAAAAPTRSGGGATGGAMLTRSHSAAGSVAAAPPTSAPAAVVRRRSSGRGVGAASVTSAAPSVPAAAGQSPTGASTVAASGQWQSQRRAGGAAAGRFVVEAAVSAAPHISRLGDGGAATAAPLLPPATQVVAASPQLLPPSPVDGATLHHAVSARSQPAAHGRTRAGSAAGGASRSNSALPARQAAAHAADFSPAAAPAAGGGDAAAAAVAASGAPVYAIQSFFSPELDELLAGLQTPSSLRLRAASAGSGAGAGSGGSGAAVMSRAASGPDAAGGDTPAPAASTSPSAGAASAAPMVSAPLPSAALSAPSPSSSTAPPLHDHDFPVTAALEAHFAPQPPPVPQPAPHTPPAAAAGSAASSSSAAAAPPPQPPPAVAAHPTTAPGTWDALAAGITEDAGVSGALAAWAAQPAYCLTLVTEAPPARSHPHWCAGPRSAERYATAEELFTAAGAPLQPGGGPFGGPAFDDDAAATVVTGVAVSWGLQRGQSFVLPLPPLPAPPPAEWRTRVSSVRLAAKRAAIRHACALSRQARARTRAAAATAVVAVTVTAGGAGGDLAASSRAQTAAASALPSIAAAGGTGGSMRAATAAAPAPVPAASLPHEVLVRIMAFLGARRARYSPHNDGGNGGGAVATGRADVFVPPVDDEPPPILLQRRRAGTGAGAGTCATTAAPPPAPALLPQDRPAREAAFSRLQNGAGSVCRAWYAAYVDAARLQWERVVRRRWEAVRAALANPLPLKVVWDAKRVLQTLAAAGVAVAGELADPGVAAWLLDPGNDDEVAGGSSSGGKRGSSKQPAVAGRAPSLSNLLLSDYTSVPALQAAVDEVAAARAALASAAAPATSAAAPSRAPSMAASTGGGASSVAAAPASAAAPSGYLLLDPGITAPLQPALAAAPAAPPAVDHSIIAALRGWAAQQAAAEHDRRRNGGRGSPHSQAAPCTAADRARYTWVLMASLAVHLRAYRLDVPFRYIEMPLAPVLAGMERAGVGVQAFVLRKALALYRERLAVLRQALRDVGAGYEAVHLQRQLATTASRGYAAVSGGNPSAGASALRLDSPACVADVVYAFFGLPLPPEVAAELGLTTRGGGIGAGGRGPTLSDVLTSLEPRVAGALVTDDCLSAAVAAAKAAASALLPAADAAGAGAASADPAAASRAQLRHRTLTQGVHFVGLYREYRSLQATFTRHLAPLVRAVCDGSVVDAALGGRAVPRVRPAVHFHTSTGRLAVTRPPLQQTPKELVVARVARQSLHDEITSGLGMVLVRSNSTAAARRADGGRRSDWDADNGGGVELMDLDAAMASPAHSKCLVVAAQASLAASARAAAARGDFPLRPPVTVVRTRVGHVTEILYRRSLLDAPADKAAAAAAAVVAPAAAAAAATAAVPQIRGPAPSASAIGGSAGAAIPAQPVAPPRQAAQAAITLPVDGGAAMAVDDGDNGVAADAVPPSGRGGSAPAAPVAGAAVEESAPLPQALPLPYVDAVLAAGPGSLGPGELAQCPLAEYWRRCGFDYPDDRAAGVAQVMVSVRRRVDPATGARLAGAGGGGGGLADVDAGDDGLTSLSFPADRVYRLTAPLYLPPPAHAADAGGCYPWSTPETLRPREAFVAAPGHVLLGADYAQVELRVAAHYSRDARLVAAFTAGGGSGSDVFATIAAEWKARGIVLAPSAVAGDGAGGGGGAAAAAPSAEPAGASSSSAAAATGVSRAERDRVKGLVYAICYGKGVAALAADLGVTRDAARGLVAAFRSSFPGLHRFLNGVAAAAARHGCVHTLFGRQRRLPGVRSPDPAVRSAALRQAVNTLTQGSAADLVKLAMSNIVARLPGVVAQAEAEAAVAAAAATAASAATSPAGPVAAPTAPPPPPLPPLLLSPVSGLPRVGHPPARLVLQVHDELLLEVRADLLAPVAALVAGCMERSVALDVPLVVKLKAGKRWGAMEPLEVPLPAAASPVPPPASGFVAAAGAAAGRPSE